MKGAFSPPVTNVCALEHVRHLSRKHGDASRDPKSGTVVVLQGVRQDFCRDSGELLGIELVRQGVFKILVSNKILSEPQQLHDGESPVDAQLFEILWNGSAASKPRLDALKSADHDGSADVKHHHTHYDKPGPVEECKGVLKTLAIRCVHCLHELIVVLPCSHEDLDEDLYRRVDGLKLLNLWPKENRSGAPIRKAQQKEENKEVVEVLPRLSDRLGN
mmetsp:Transcript_30476/g.71135  ORF Transcript_30476/g.71135 Transcript_30476/m.71135 type:complete len:218 (-) Transcript_30476:937-1590(-)